MKHGHNRKKASIRGGVIAVAVLALLAAAPAALAAKPQPPASQLWAPGYEISYTETVMDGAGNVVSQTHRDGLPAGQVFGSASRANSGLGAATNIDPGSNLAAAIAAAPTARRVAGCCSSSGSDTVTFTLTRHTALGWIAWRYRQVNHWCWNYPNITCLSIGSGFYDVDGQEVVNYDDHGYGWYYGWAGGGNGGHYSYRNGSVSNCIFRYGCFQTDYPWVEMWLNGNGAWAADGGGGD